MRKHEISNIVHSAIAEVSPGAAALLTKWSETRNHEIFFVDLGINSIDYAEIAHIVMGKLNVDYPLDIFTCTNSINDVTDIFYDLVAVEA